MVLLFQPLFQIRPASCQCPPVEDPQEHPWIWTSMLITHSRKGECTPWATVVCLSKRLLGRTYRTCLTEYFGEDPRKQRFILGCYSLRSRTILLLNIPVNLMYRESSRAKAVLGKEAAVTHISQAVCYSVVWTMFTLCLCLDTITKWLCFCLIPSWSQSGLVWWWFSVKLFTFNRRMSRPS